MDRFHLFFPPCDPLTEAGGVPTVCPARVIPHGPTTNVTKEEHMALSRLQKGLIGLAIALVAVIAVGYAGMRYLENAVADAVRTWAAQTPPDARVEVGDVAYTFADNRLVLKNLRADYKLPGQRSAVIGVEELEIRKPGSALLSLMRDPKAEIKETQVDVAENITLHRLSVGPDPALTTEKRSLSDVKIDAALLKKLIASPTSDQWSVALDLAYGLSIVTDVSNNLKVTLKELPFEIAIREVADKGYQKGHLERCLIKDVTVRSKDKDIFSIADLTLENMNMPPREAMVMFNKVASRKETPSEEQALEWMKAFFGGPQPLLGSLALRDMRIAAGLATITLEKLNYTNPTTEPFAFNLALEHLKMPVAVLPELQLLSLMGLGDVDASASFFLSLPAKDGAFESTASLNLANLGTADVAFKGVLPQDVLKEAFRLAANSQSADTQEDTEEAVAQLFDDNMKISHMELGYADEGLLPRLGVIGQKLMGLSPAQCVEMAKSYLEENAGVASDNPNVPKLIDFIDRPGAIRVIFAPDRPMLTGDMEDLPADTPFMKLEVTPGPKTVQEEMADLMK